MARTTPEWIGATDDAKPPPRVRVRIYERYKGICYRSGRKIMPGDKWQCDHVVALINGGENRESNMAPILDEPHKEKTAEDVATKSKTARIRAKHLGVFPKPRARIQSRGFQKR